MTSAQQIRMCAANAIRRRSATRRKADRPRIDPRFRRCRRRLWQAFRNGLGRLDIRPLHDDPVHRPDRRDGGADVQAARRRRRSAILDTDGLRSRGSVQVGASPEHMVPSPAGDILYVNDVNDGSVSVIDLAARQVMRTIKAGAVLHRIDVAADGSYLLVADVGDDRIARIDIDTGAVDIAEMPFSPYHLTFIPGGAKVYVSSASDEILRIVDPTTLAVSGDLTIGGKSHQMTPVSGS